MSQTDKLWLTTGETTRRTYSEPTLLPGGLVVDDRGTVVFVNEFDPAEHGIRRCYTVSNHAVGYVRAWHYHRFEGKYVMAISGSAIVAAVKIDDWEKPSAQAPVSRFVLSDRTPGVLAIPPGYANGFKTLEPGTRLLFMSTATLEESRADDIRYPARHWNIWDVEER